MKAISSLDGEQKKIFEAFASHKHVAILGGAGICKKHVLKCPKKVAQVMSGNLVASRNAHARNSR